MVGPFQIVAARPQGAAATNKAVKIPIFKETEDDLSIFIEGVRFKLGFCSRIFGIIKTVKNIGGIKDSSNCSRDKNLPRLN